VPRHKKIKKKLNDENKGKAGGRGSADDVLPSAGLKKAGRPTVSAKKRETPGQKKKKQKRP
jgi:hypothetical protein